MKTTWGTAFTTAALAALLIGCSGTADTKNISEGEKKNSESGFRLPWSKPKTVTIPEGTPIKVRTTTALSTKTAQAGETFTASLVDPILVDGKVVVAAGSTVEGAVVESDAGGRVKGVATLAVRLTRLHTPKEAVTVQTGSVAREARTTKKKDATTVGIGAGIGAAIGAIAGGGQGAAIGAASGAGAGTGVVLATRGESAVIPAESVLTFKLTAPVTVEPI